MLPLAPGTAGVVAVVLLARPADGSGGEIVVAEEIGGCTDREAGSELFAQFERDRIAAAQASSEKLPAKRQRRSET